MPTWLWHAKPAFAGGCRERNRRLPGGHQKKDRLNRWARQTRFYKRKGKISPYEFLVLMAIGQMGMKHLSLAGMVAAIQSRISRVALHYRFSSEAAGFLFKCLGFVLQQKVSRVGHLNTKLLRYFRRVLILDSSSWGVHESLRGVLPGSGGAASTANCKLQTLYDYKSGEFQFLEVTAGIVPDNRYTDHVPDLVNKGDLILFDQGYFKLTTLAAIVAKGAFFLTRFLVRTTVAHPTTQEPIVLEKQLQCLATDTYEMNVRMGSEDSTTVVCRLIALRVSEQVANERRRRLNREAQKKGRSVSQYHRRMCAWTLLITNVPPNWLPLEMVRAFYTVRWQIELIFKQFKSILRVHQSDTGKEQRLRCELYGKLIGAVIIHRIHAAETNRLWNIQHREVSMDKLYKRFQERAFTLLRLLIANVCDAFEYLRTQIRQIIPACLKSRQRSRLTTLEMLEAQCDPMLSANQFAAKKHAA